VVACDSGGAFARAAGGVQADEDRLPFADGAFDLVVSVGALDGVNDLPGALLLARRALRPDGLFSGPSRAREAFPGSSGRCWRRTPSRAEQRLESIRRSTSAPRATCSPGPASRCRWSTWSRSTFASAR
jgi:SAM-dependent methyltransferase